MNILEITAEKKPVKELIRLAAYCRVSSDSEDQLHSLAAQIRYYKNYEKNNPEFKLVDVYADEGITGTSMEKRDELNRLLRDCNKGLIDRIIVKSVSRFARNTQELLTAIRFLKDIGVGIYFEEQGIDSDKLNSEMILTFPGMAAQKESEAISGNIRWSYKKRMESGEFNCNTPAYGFNLIDGKLIVNEAEAVVVRRIFELYLQGYGIRAIARLLNEEGISRRNNQKAWNGVGIGYMLNNERYMGDALLQKKYTTDTVPFKKIRNRGELTKYYIENANPAIVSKETFDAVQRLQKSRQNKERAIRETYPLSRMLRCPDCGRSYRRHLINGKACWVCSGKASGATICSSQIVTEEGMCNAFNRMLYKLQRHHNLLLGPLIKDLERVQSRTNEDCERVTQIDKEIADLAARNLVIVRLHTNGILNGADYTEQSSVINNRIRALRSERKKRFAADEGIEQLDSLKELQSVLSEYNCNAVDTFDEELFHQIVAKAIVVSKSEVTFRLIGGLELTEFIECRN